MKLFLLIPLLFLACEDKTFTRIYQKEQIGKTIPSISISENNQTIKTMAEKILKNEHFTLQAGAAYVLELEGSTYPKKCNNPNATTYDATYDGYIKLTLLKNMKRLYMCQKDYHGDLNPSIISDLITQMKKDLALP
jgi:hypothetical protein